MNTKFLKYLVDPENGKKLKLVTVKKMGNNVIEGSLKSSKNKYPVVNGVPRFAGLTDKGSYAKSFGFEWNTWSRVQFERENKGKPMEGHTTKMWEKITGKYATGVKNKLIIDYGCGSGRFIDIARKKGAAVIGLDITDAVDAAAKNFEKDKNVLICQADILKSPVKTGAADGAYSVGVLHHTENPGKGFSEMYRTLKNKGWIAVSVYGSDGYYTSSIVGIYRKIFKLLWPVFGPYPPLFYSYLICYLVYFLSKIPVLKYANIIIGLIFPNIMLPDIRWSVLDTFDSITPSNQTGHSMYEVYNWFKKAGASDIEPSDWGGSSINALKH